MRQITTNTYRRKRPHSIIAAGNRRDHGVFTSAAHECPKLNAAGEEAIQPQRAPFGRVREIGPLITAVCGEELSPSINQPCSFALVTKLTPVPVLLVLAGLLAVTGSGRAANDQPATPSLRFWQQWRGPLANGVAPLANPPTEWSERKNIRWKIELSGKGHSSPIVFGDRVYVTAAAPVGKEQKPVHDSAPGVHDSVPVTHTNQYMVIALSRTDGRVLWKKVVREGWPHEGGHETGSPASNSPITDGGFLYAFFGSRGLYCLDTNGTVKWQADLGKMQTLHAHGEGSSPALYGDTLIVNWDHEGASFLYAFDKLTGKQRWKVARDEKTSWSTPLVVESEGKPQVVISATKRVRGYDLANGALIWECPGLTDNVVSSPV